MTTSPSPDTRVVTLRGERELFERAGHLFAAREEFLCAAKDLTVWAMTSTRTEAVRTMRARLDSGLEVAKLYSPAVLADATGTEHLREVAALGARVRICRSPLAHETILIDRRIAIIAGERVDGVRSYGVVRAPEVVAGVRSLFWSTWQGAIDLADHTPDDIPDVDEAGLVILRLLSAGRKDEAAAREAGMSLRTYRRRVAELMTALGAESRFQAGVRARALGLRL